MMIDVITELETREIRRILIVTSVPLVHPPPLLTDAAVLPACLPLPTDTAVQPVYLFPPLTGTAVPPVHLFLPLTDKAFPPVHPLPL